MSATGRLPPVVIGSSRPKSRRLLIVKLLICQRRSHSMTSNEQCVDVECLSIRKRSRLHRQCRTQHPPTRIDHTAALGPTASHGVAAIVDVVQVDAGARSQPTTPLSLLHPPGAGVMSEYVPIEDVTGQRCCLIVPPVPINVWRKP